MQPGLDVLSITDSISCARLGPVFVVHYVGTLTLEDLNAIRRARERFPDLERTATFGLIEPNLGLPSGDVLRRATSLARATVPSNVAEATVLLGGGVRAAGARQLVQRLFARYRPLPAKIFGDIPSACTWLAERFPEDDGLAFALELGLAELRTSRPRISTAPGGDDRRTPLPPLAFGPESERPGADAIAPAESGFPGLDPALAPRERFVDTPGAPAPLHSFVDDLLGDAASDDLPTPAPRPRRRR